MKTKKIGIVLESARDEDRLFGHLAKLHVSMELDEFWRPVVKAEIEKINIIINPKEKWVSVLTGTIDDAYEVVEKLQDIGYNLKTFYFEGMEHTCSA